MIISLVNDPLHADLGKDGGERRKDGGQKCKKEPHAEFPPKKRYRFRFPGVVPNRSL